MSKAMMLVYLNIFNWDRISGSYELWSDDEDDWWYMERKDNKNMIDFWDFKEQTIVECLEEVVND